MASQPWSEREDALMRREYRRSGAAQLARRLRSRSQTAIERRAVTLGISRAVESAHTPWTADEIASLHSTYPRYGSQATAKELPGRTRKAVKLMAARLGVSYLGE